MNWNNHSSLKDQHAFLSASKYHWVNYDDEKLDSVYLSWLAIQKGTELHELASKLIDLRQKLSKTQTSIKQLEIYAALFCLEYGFHPNEINIELRLYQYDEVLVHHPEPEELM